MALEDEQNNRKRGRWGLSVTWQEVDDDRFRRVQERAHRTAEKVIDMPHSSALLTIVHIRL